MEPKQIDWAKDARYDREEILDFWKHQPLYAETLNNLFKEEIQRIARMPGIGRASESFPGAHRWVVLHWEIYYRVVGEHLRILRIWDTRRNPEDLSL